MLKKNRHIEISLRGQPPVKQPGPYEKEKNKKRRVRLRQQALIVTRETNWPVDLFDKNMKITIWYNRYKGGSDSANIIGGIADALQGSCYHNDSQLVEVHYSQEGKSKKKYKSDRYEVIVEPVDSPKKARRK